MRIEVHHSTVFRFSERARYSIHHLRLMPRPAIGQRVVGWAVMATQRMTSWTDGYGNEVKSFAINGPHAEVRIELKGAFEAEEEGVGYLTYGLDAEPLPPGFWLRNTGLAQYDASVAAFAADLKGRVESDPISVLHGLMTRINGGIEYRTGASGTGATAADTLARQSGVCQDHAHLFIACCRSLGIPARYVSGYMRVLDEHRPANASHAWAEAFVPYLGWIGFDAANRICPTGNYLKLAVGLDYAEAAPVTGLRIGGGHADMQVEVDVAPPRLADAMASNQ